MQSNLEDQAIKAALDGNWNKAVEINRTILQDFPEHIPALNRLARAYSQLGDTDTAIATYEKVLSLDKFNLIAKKNCDLLKKSPCPNAGNAKVINTDFIEEPGKTKTSQLVRLGDAQVLRTLQPGQLVDLVVKNHWIAVTTLDKIYIGTLADNISFNLKQFIAGGNKFQAVVRTVSNNQVTIFLREIHREPKFANTPSF